MALRIAEYSVRIYRQFGKFPKQIVLYVGERKMRMNRRLSGPDMARPDFTFQYTLVDTWELDGVPFLESARVEDLSGPGDLALVPCAAAAESVRQMTWERFWPLVDCWIPSAKILHPHPNVRFDAIHPRQEPYAAILHVPIYAGASGKPASLPRQRGQKPLAGARGSETRLWKGMQLPNSALRE